MPAYNAGPFIATAIEAVQAQTIDGWELVIVDDCSTDSTLAIARSYAASDTRIRVFGRTAPSGGAYVPRTEAIGYARGEIIAPLDADDSIGPDYLERMLGHKRRGDLQAVYPICYDWDGAGEPVLHHLPDFALTGRALRGRDAVKYTLDGWRIHCAGGLIDKDLMLRSIAMTDEVAGGIMSFFDEYLTRILLYNAGRVAMVDERYVYRVNTGSVTHSRDIRRLGTLGNNRRLIDFVESRYPTGSEERLLVHRQNFHGVVDAMRMLRRLELDRNESADARRQIAANRALIDRKILKGRVSPRYSLLLRMPLILSMPLLRIADVIMGCRQAASGAQRPR